MASSAAFRPEGYDIPRTVSDGMPELPARPPWAAAELPDGLPLAAGRNASFYTADRWATEIGLQVSEAPPEEWRDESAKTH